MKNKIGIILIAAILAAGTWFFYAKKTARQIETPAPGVIPVSVTVAKPGENPPAAPKPKQPTAPLRIRFEATEQPALGKPVPVVFSVYPNPSVWPKNAQGEGRIEWLLRLPSGVKLESDGWEPAELSAQDKKEGWSLYQHTEKATIPSEPGTEPLSQQKASLIIAEPGVNWVITVRARIVRGSESWQAFGAVFATADSQKAEFHTAPKLPSAGEVKTEERIQKQGA